ncbi:hypothetical protein CLOP_g14086, partial [Closterium sp. NIES-67]
FHRFGTCSSSSFGIALVANKAGGYWNTAMFVKGLSFGSGTNKFWATPNPSSGAPPRGGLVARFYAIRDLDGSLLGQSGYAVANYDPILPPAAVRASKCSYKSAFSAYSCSSVCYRSIGLQYDESGAGPSATGTSGTPSAVIRPYSYLKITRTDDGTIFYAYGTDNDDPNSGPAGSGKKTRYLTASLLAGYTYRIEVVPAETNSNFYPSKMQLNVFDWQGCSGPVTLVIDTPNSRSKWLSSAPTVPCSSVDATRVYKEYACGNGKARLQLDVGASTSGKGLTTMDLDSDTTTSCSSDSACSVSTSSLPPLSVSPLGGTESSFSSVDPFFDPSFYEPGTGSSTGSNTGASTGSSTGSNTGASTGSSGTPDSSTTPFSSSVGKFQSYIPSRGSTSSSGGAYTENGDDDYSENVFIAGSGTNSAGSSSIAGAPAPPPAPYPAPPPAAAGRNGAAAAAVADTAGVAVAAQAAGEGEAARELFSRMLLRKAAPAPAPPPPTRRR